MAFFLSPFRCSPVSLNDKSHAMTAAAVALSSSIAAVTGTSPRDYHDEYVDRGRAQVKQGRLPKSVLKKQSMYGVLNNSGTVSSAAVIGMGLPNSGNGSMTTLPNAREAELHPDLGKSSPR